MIKISLITVCYNCANTIAYSITSVNDQTYTNIEHIIIDGSSVDKTIEVIKNMPNRITTLISEPDNGIYDAINKGISIATGDIIGLVHSGDLLSNNEVLSDISKVFETQDCDILYANTECFLPSQPTKIIRIDKGGIYKRSRFKKGWIPSHPTVYCKKAVFNKIGTYRLDLKIGADYEFLLRAMYVHHFKIHYLDSIIYKFELGGTSNKSIKNIILANKECKNAWIINGMRVPSFFIFNKLLRKIPQFIRPIINKLKFNLSLSKSNLLKI